jgi:hypothetical protein
VDEPLVVSVTVSVGVFVVERLRVSVRVPLSPVTVGTLLREGEKEMSNVGV